MALTRLSAENKAVSFFLSESSFQSNAVCRATRFLALDRSGRWSSEDLFGPTPELLKAWSSWMGGPTQSSRQETEPHLALYAAHLIKTKLSVEPAAVFNLSPLLRLDLRQSGIGRPSLE